MTKDFEQYMADLGYTWSMEVLDKTTATLIGLGDVTSLLVRYIFVDALQVKHVFECYTWCPEITAVSYIPTTTLTDIRLISFNETETVETLYNLKEGEKIGTAKEVGDVKSSIEVMGISR